MEFSCEMIQRVSGIEPREALLWIENLGYEISVIQKSDGEISPTTVEQLINHWGALTRIEDLLLSPR
jgi:hypothetical protein